MSRVPRWSRAVVVAAGLSLVAGPALASSFEVTITNLTKGQIISPPVVAAHDPAVAIFSAGQPASDELAALAEDADNGGLVGLLESIGADVAQGDGVILPGGSATIRIDASRGNRVLSAVGMLVTTNDTFFGLNSQRLRSRTQTTRVVAYDAGSEANNESCAFIPGPPCGNPFQRDTEEAEGFVHIHNGVHGIADLVPSRHDWRNPVVQVTVKRVRGGEEDDD